MIVVMNYDADAAAIDLVMRKIRNAGLQIHLSRGVERTIIGVVGNENGPGKLSGQALEAMPGVEKVVPILQPYKLSSKVYHSEPTLVQVGGQQIGGKDIHVIAGPCAVENREQLLRTAKLIRQAGATFLRGGAFKPRTSPYSFQGLAKEGLEMLAEARELTGLPVVTEATDVNTLDLVAGYADMIQIGTRNMQNFFLLREVAKIGKPILLKRGSSSTIEEWLLAAEYILAEGNGNVVLCERGIRTFEHYTRNTLDLTAVPVVKHLSHLPIIVDPSHAIGKWQFVAPMARAAIAAGADGLLIEVHPNPAEALCDGPQSLNPDNFNALMAELKGVAKVLQRRLGQPSQMA